MQSLQPFTPVHVELEDGYMPGLVLKIAGDGRLLVTYERDGHVTTAWVRPDQVRADLDGSAPEPRSG